MEEEEESGAVGWIEYGFITIGIMYLDEITWTIIWIGEEFDPLCIGYYNSINKQTSWKMKVEKKKKEWKFT